MEFFVIAVRSQINKGTQKYNSLHKTFRGMPVCQKNNKVNIKAGLPAVSVDLIKLRKKKNKKQRRYAPTRGYHIEN